jgi:hypothetical protein
MPSLEHIGVSILTNSEGMLASFPPRKKPEQSIINNIKDAVFRSMNFTSKFCNLCEISGKDYQNDLLLHKINGAEYIRNHHCAGNIQYHQDYKHFLDDVDIYFEIQEKYFQKHSFDNMKLKFQRSSGEKVEGTVVKNSGILYLTSRDEIGLYITFKLAGEDMFKWVPLNDTYSNSLKKETKGLLSLNETLKEQELIIYVKETPEWLKIERETFIDMMKVYLDKTKLTYSFRQL